MLIDQVRAIRSQPASRDEGFKGIYRRQSVFCCQCQNEVAADNRTGGRDNQTAPRRLAECRQAALYCSGIAVVDRTQINSKRWCSSLDCGELTNARGITGVP